MRKTAFWFLIFIIVLTFALGTYSLMEPMDNINPSEAGVEIKKGMSGRTIANQLEEKGVIKSADVFYLMLRLKDVDDLRAGYYRFSTSNTPQEIIAKLQQGEEEEFKITIPEGLTFVEILDRFTALEFPNYDREKLESAIYDELKKVDLDFSFEQKEFDIGTISPAEGFIIPTTYNFPMSYEEKDIAEDLINYFIKQRLPVLKDGAAEKDFSAYDLLIIASLIEEEGKIESENKIIASVIYNRLEQGMPLQLDATIQYLLPERTERVLYSDLEIESPYNTYQISSLPPTPIASPGAQAVEAAVNPAETDYLYYFAREDGSHVFTESYEHHLQKQRRLN